MGTINYGSSEIVTIGQLMFKEENYDEYDYDEARAMYSVDTEDIRISLEKLLKDFKFQFYKIKYEYGYYEGIYLDINLDTCVYYGGTVRDYKQYNYVEDEEERTEILEEIDKIKEFLHKCIEENDMYVIYPGWCTKELGYDESLKEVDERIEEEKEKIKSFLTWKELVKQEKINA